MSRSRRNIPIMGITNSTSEKGDKQRAAMRVRKKVHDCLKPHLAGDEDFDFPPLVEHPRSGQWTFAKDGKHFWSKATAREMRK